MGSCSWCALWLCLLCCCLSAAGQSSNCSAQSKQYTYDGSCNNIDHPSWGSANTFFARQPMSPDYSTNWTRSPREVSYALGGLRLSQAPSTVAEAPATAAEYSSVYNNKLRSSYTDMLTYLAQLVSHDMGWTKSNRTSPHPIRVPTCDLWFDKDCAGNKTLPFFGSSTNATSSPTVRQQTNYVSSFVDLGVLYGDSQDVSLQLREMRNGRLLNTSDGNLPYNVNQKLPMENPMGLLAASQLRMTGNMRINQNPGMIAIITVMMREHNRWAGIVKAAHPDWEDEQLFQEARRFTIATWQKIVYYEYLPTLKLILPLYSGYNASVDPSTDNFFSVAAYRYGHTEINDLIHRVDDYGVEIEQGHLDLVRSYYNPESYLDEGIDPILRGLTMGRQGEVFPNYAVAVQHQFMAYPFSNGTDIVSLDISRNRDHGIPRYNDARAAFGLPRKPTWESVTLDPTLRTILPMLYTSPDQCDAYICGLCEDKANGSVHHGELFRASLLDQFRRTRDGDRLYFEAAGNFDADELAQIWNRSLRSVILDNTDIKVLPDNIYYQPDNSSPWPVTALGTTTNQTAGNCSLNLFGGDYVIAWTPVNGNPDKMQFSISARFGIGWIGLGWADSNNSAMNRADLIIIQLDSSTNQAMVNDYWSPLPGYPIPDQAQGGVNNVDLVSKNYQNGQWSVVVQRPILSSDKNDRNISRSGKMPMLFAYRPGTTWDLYAHENSHARQMSVDLMTCESEQVKVDSHRDWVKRHGILMSISFALVYQIGALCARMIRATIITSEVTKHYVFYAHMLLQLTGTTLATAAFIIIIREHAPYRNQRSTQLYGHGVIGIIVMTAVYCQVLLGLLRPSADPRNPTLARQIWGGVHMAFGKATLYLGIFNMFLGIYLIHELYFVKWNAWVALCASSLGVIFVAQQLFDGIERQHMTKELYRLSPDRHARLPPAAAAYHDKRADEVYPSISMNMDQDPETEMSSASFMANQHRMHDGNGFSNGKH